MNVMQRLVYLSVLAGVFALGTDKVFAQTDGPFFNTFTWSPDTRQWTFRGESLDDSGQRELFLLDTLTSR